MSEQVSIPPYRFKYGIRPMAEEMTLIANTDAPLCERMRAIARTSWYPRGPGCHDDACREAVMQAADELEAHAL